MGEGRKFQTRAASRTLKESIRHPDQMLMDIVEWGLIRKVSIFMFSLLKCSCLHPDQKYLNHIDHDPSNNVLENLEWTTASNNIWLSHKHGRKSNGEKRSKKVRARKVGETEWIIYNSGAEASRALGIHTCRISDMCHEALAQTNTN